MTFSTASLPDAEIWHRLKQGDEQAVTWLMRRYFDDLYRYGCRLCPETTIIEDSIQEMFVDLWVRRQRLSDVAAVKSYLFTSLRRRLLKQMSTIRKHEASGLDDHYFFALDISPEELLIEHQHSQELSQRLSEYIQQLPPRQKEAVYLRFFENLTYEDIASVMSVSVAYLYELIHKAVANLRKRFLLVLNLALLILSLF
ncbi:MAG: sigma-70 family RNA polymerase sigma factor [Cytophagales bacterium]|jgi:RNA polymerase sigma factor (sigma-70 family)|nr:sigma-70 family RNA polymerase sigma factor [Cytophagales bacterium]